MFGWLQGLRGVGKLLSLIVDIVRGYKRHEKAEEAQAEYNSVEHDPDVQWDSMFNVSHAEKTSSADFREHNTH